LVNSVKMFAGELQRRCVFGRIILSDLNSRLLVIAQLDELERPSTNRGTMWNRYIHNDGNVTPGTIATTKSRLHAMNEMSDSTGGRTNYLFIEPT
jgi:hypothetical protein